MEQENILEITQDSEVFARKIMAAEIINRITTFIILKGLHEQKEQNENSKLSFDNVSFWFQHKKDILGNVIHTDLRFDTKPDIWNFEKILMTIEEKEKMMLAASGVTFDGLEYLPRY